jgi:hypothetical protein
MQRRRDAALRSDRDQDRTLDRYPEESLVRVAL